MMFCCVWYFTIIWAYRGPLPPVSDMWHGEPVCCAVYTVHLYRWCSTVYTWAVLCHHQVGYPTQSPSLLCPSSETVRVGTQWTLVHMLHVISISCCIMSSELVTWDTCSCDTNPGNMVQVGGARVGYRGWSETEQCPPRTPDDKGSGVYIRFENLWIFYPP